MAVSGWNQNSAGEVVSGLSCQRLEVRFETLPTESIKRLFRGFFDRHRATDQRAAVPNSFYLEGGPDEAGAVIHNTQPHACRPTLQVRKSLAVILDRKQ